MKSYQQQNSIKNFLDEPEIFYNIQNKYSRITSVLGGSEVLGQSIHNDIDLINITRKGLPKSVVLTLSTILSISMEKMSSLIHVSHRTLQRKGDNDLLNVYSTEQILEIAEVISRGIAVLGSIEAFVKWVHSDLRSLDDQSPLNFLDTSFGTQLVKDILGRLEQGVYS